MKITIGYPFDFFGSRAVPPYIGSKQLMTTESLEGKFRTNRLNLSAPAVKDKKRIARIVPVKVVVDTNRDGELPFDGKDQTAAKKPLRFGINVKRANGHTVDRLARLPETGRSAMYSLTNKRIQIAMCWDSGFGVGVFFVFVDLKSDFGFDSMHKGHSAQFRTTVQKRWSYWTRFLNDNNITSITP